MGIENCIIIYNATINSSLIVDNFIKKLNKNGINYILLNNDNNDLNKIVNNYNQENNIIISLDTKDVNDTINKIFKKESQNAFYYHIDFNPYIKDFIKLKKILEEISLEDIVKYNQFKINDCIYYNTIVIGENIFNYLPKTDSLKNKLISIFKYKKFKHCFDDKNKRDIIYLSEKECGNQFFYFGIITTSKNYNSINIFENDDQLNILLIKKLKSNEIFKLFKIILLNKKIPDEVLKKCIIISTNNLKLISNDGNKIYIDDKKSESYASYELEFVYENKIKIIKKR